MVRRPKEKKARISLDEFKSRIKTADLNAFFIFGAIILVLAIGFYAIFSPGAKNLRRGNPACGKIVVAADRPSLKANVSPTLSGARYFLVINPLSKKLLEAAKNPYAGMQAAGSGVAYFIAGKGEEAAIAGSVNPQVCSILSQLGIRTFGGYNGKVGDVIDLYRQARISQGLSPMDRGVNSTGATRAAFSLGQYVFRCPRCNWATNSPGNWGMSPVCPNCRISTVWGGAGQVGNNLATPAAFGFGQQAFVCPACNWRTRALQQGNTYPNCPNCGVPMAKDMNNKGWDWGWPEWNPLGWAANTQSLQSNVAQTRIQPNFWQGPESLGFFICPDCNWRMYTQHDMGHYPRCPNCKAIMARGGVSYQNHRNLGPNTQVAGFANFVPAPPIYADATMPHGYRGVCSNCHQVLRGSQYGVNPQGRGGTRATWGNLYNSRGTCILR